MKEVKELAMFIIEAGMALDKSLIDKKIDASDLVNFLPILLKAPEALKGTDKIIEEYKASSREQRDALVNEIKEALDLKSDSLENKIEASLVFANQMMIFVSAIKG
jgi:aspartate/methionine/tyrosine aminotransferase